MKNSRLVLTPAPAGEHAAGQPDDAPEIAFLQQLALGLDEGVFVGAEEHAFVQHDAAAAAGLQAVDDVLEEEDLGGAGLVGEMRLRLLALLAAEGRIHQDHVEEFRGTGNRPP